MSKYKYLLRNYHAVEHADIAICSFFTASIDKKHYIASVDQLKEVIKEIEDEIIT